MVDSEERKPRKTRQVVIHKRRPQEDSEHQEYRIYKHSLYGDDRKEVVVQGHPSPRFDKHLRVKHRNFRYVAKEEESEDSSPEEAIPNHDPRPHPRFDHRGGHLEERHQRYPKICKQLYSSATDVKEGPRVSFGHGDRHNTLAFNPHLRDIERHRDNSYQIDTKSQSDHDNVLGDYRKHYNFGEFGHNEIHRRIPDISEEPKHYHQNHRGDFADNYFFEKYPNRHLQQSQSESKNFNTYCCNRAEGCNRCCNSLNVLKNEDSLKEVIEKLKSEFIITPKQKETLLKKAVAQDDKGVYVYVPLEEKDPKKVARRLDKIYKNIYSADESETETARRKQGLRKIIEKYSYPERFKAAANNCFSCSTTEEKILCETFFKKCEEEGIQPRTTFNTSPSPTGSVAHILEDISRLSPKATDSEFLAKFESRLKRAIRNREDHCTCPPSSSPVDYWTRRLSDHKLDPHIDNLVGVLRRR